MLYDSENTLSNDVQSSQQAESILQQQRRELTLAAPTAQLADKQRFIHFMQDKHFRLPHLVVRFGSQIIKGAAGKLGNAVWDMYERVLVAALDAHDYAASSWALGALEDRWGPSSQRVGRLRAMVSEARGHLSEAEGALAALLEADPTSAPAMRRQVALAKAAGETGMALVLLNKYVRVHASDEAAWLELSELYVHTNQYELASFAMEELLLLAPENYLTHLRYAELAYTLGQFDTARAYYSQSLELKPYNNIRALYGLQLCLKQKTNAAAAATQQLQQWSMQQLQAHYRKFAPALAPIMTASLSGEAVPAAAVATSTAANSTAAAANFAAVAAAVAAAREERAAAAAAAALAAEVDEPTTPQESDLPD